MQLVKEKENSAFKPDKLCLKIDLVSYPTRVEGLVHRIISTFVIGFYTFIHEMFYIYIYIYIYTLRKTTKPVT